MNRIVLENINVFNPVDSKINFNQNILINEHGEIEDVSSDKHNNIKKIDCTGKFAIAGMFECHAHLAAITSEDKKFQSEILDELAETKLKCTWDEFPSLILKKFTDRGITQIRDVGGPIDNLRNLNIKVQSGEILGPEIFYAGPMLESSPLNWEKSNSSLPGFTVAIDSAEDLKILDELKEKGASLIKTFGKYDKNLYRKLIKKAKSLNLPVTHDPGKPLFNNIPMEFALDEGITCIEHSKSPLPCVLTPEIQTQHDKHTKEHIEFKAENPNSDVSKEMQEESREIFDKVIQLKHDAICKEKLSKLIKKTLADDFYFCPTMDVNKYFPSGLKAIPELSDYFVCEMIKAGTKMLVGHDGIMAESTYSEMKHLHKAGLSLSEIIKGATIYPAKWLNVDSNYGSIDPQKKANICILNSNPLESIENIEDVFMVLKNGAIVFQK